MNSYCFFLTEMWNDPFHLGSGCNQQKKRMNEWMNGDKHYLELNSFGYQAVVMFCVIHHWNCLWVLFGRHEKIHINNIGDHNWKMNEWRKKKTKENNQTRSTCQYWIYNKLMYAHMCVCVCEFNLILITKTKYSRLPFLYIIKWWYVILNLEINSNTSI